jgi:hypothetical protein
MLTATRPTISPSTKIITYDSTPDRDLCGPSRTLRMDLRIRRLGFESFRVCQYFPLSEPTFCAQPASASGEGGPWEPLDLSSASDIRAAATRFWPSTSCPYTSFVIATLECPRTSETTQRSVP